MTRFADALDSKFRIPGTPFRFGWDSVLGLLPGVGDAASATMAFGLVAYAASLGIRFSLVARMAFNVAVDLVVGSIPLVGDIFDFAFKANRRNVALLRREWRMDDA
ncbi:MAG: DUF4112 domain-containing protein [Alphaproteobacteria bacterium]